MGSAMSLLIEVPLFNVGKVEFITSYAEAQQRVLDLGLTYSVHDSLGFVEYTVLGSDGVLLLCVFDGKVTTLAHEVFHAAVRYLAYVGVPLVPDAANETHAYLIEYLMDKTLPCLGVA